MSTGCLYLVGYRQWLKFRKDKWCRDDLLGASFPSLFALVDSKDAWIEGV